MKLIFILPDADHVSILRRRRYTKNWHYSFAFKSQKITENYCESTTLIASLDSWSHFQKEKTFKTENCLFCFWKFIVVPACQPCRIVAGSGRALSVSEWKQNTSLQKAQKEMKRSLWNGKYLWIQWFLKPSEIYKFIYFRKRVSEKKGAIISKFIYFFV